MSNILKEMQREIELQSRGKPIIIQTGAPQPNPSTKGGIKTSTVVLSIVLTVVVVATVVVAIIVVNKNAEHSANVNLVHMEEEDSDEDWHDLSDDYPKMLDKSKSLKNSQKSDRDPNFTLLEDLM